VEKLETLKDYQAKKRTHIIYNGLRSFLALCCTAREMGLLVFQGGIMTNESNGVILIFPEAKTEKEKKNLK
jgi:hypothetical protein